MLWMGRKRKMTPGMNNDGEIIGALANTERCRRRTHQSGPLGELFDHGTYTRKNRIDCAKRCTGVDAVNTSLEVIIFSATMNFGQTWKTVLIQFACEFENYVALVTAVG